MEDGRAFGVPPMSHVTNVLVHVGPLDHTPRERITEPQPWDGGQALGDLRGPRGGLRGEGLIEHLRQAFQFWGGPKFPEWDMYGAAFNYLEWDRFARWLTSLPFEYPDQVLVIAKGENHDRPSVWQIVDGRLDALIGDPLSELP
jgi:hypothetical protein